MTTLARILVADDDRGLVHTLQMVLQERGYDVVTVTSGEEVLSAVSDHRPDLVLLDIMMPRIDGLQLLERMQRDEECRDIPVLMLSSMQPEEATVRSLGLGAADFIPKPFRVRELLARIEARIRDAQELRRVRDQAKTRGEVVDILHEITDSVKPEEIYHTLTRRVARVLQLSKCAIVSAAPGDRSAVLVATSENPMLRNLPIALDRYPEIRTALDSKRTVHVRDVRTDPLYADVRGMWEREKIDVPTRSVIASPFFLRNTVAGVFFLRTTEADRSLTEDDAVFAETVIKGAVSAIERAYDLEAAETDRERYQVLASTDPLTGCLNRRAMLDRLETELHRAQRYGLDLSVLMIDLDWFKDINDSRGHLVGDSVLHQLGELLRNAARTVDIVARFGGEEFTLVLPETGVEGSLVFAERVRLLIAGHEFGGGGASVRTTVSIGVATYEHGSSATVESLISSADAGLYLAKREGRNMVRRQ